MMRGAATRRAATCYKTPRYNRKVFAMTRASLVAVAAAFMLAALPSVAQTGGSPPPPARMRATIETVAGNVLTVKTEQGADATVHLTPKTNIAGVDARKLSDIKPDDFVGVTAITGKDGTMHATEIHIFPANMRGAGEGHRAWDRGPDSSMTNAAVAGMVGASDGKLLTLSYKDHATGKMEQVKIDAGPRTPIVALVAGDASLLKPGAAAVMFARKNADGSYIAFAIIAEKDGVKPPM